MNSTRSSLGKKLIAKLASAVDPVRAWAAPPAAGRAWALKTPLASLLVRMRAPSAEKAFPAEGAIARLVVWKKAAAE